MKSDKTIKVLLFTIAVGLWFNISGTNVSAAMDLEYYLRLIAIDTSRIAHSLALLTTGNCANEKLC